MSKFILPYYPSANCLLAALPREDYQRLLPHLEVVSFPTGKILSNPGEQQEYIYFPTTAVVALLYTLEDGNIAEVGLIGKEGAVGVALFLGGKDTTTQAVVQIAGAVIQLKARVLQQEFNHVAAFHRLLLHYTQFLITQLSQTAICNRFHTIEQRLCRLLLLSHDRVKGDHLKLTQQAMANMLGGRREGVALAAERLQATGGISYTRGHITIVNRQALEDSVCECYHVVKDEFERLSANDTFSGPELLALA